MAAVRLVHEAVYKLCLLAVCDGVQFGSLWGVRCNVVFFFVWSPACQLAGSYEQVFHVLPRARGGDSKCLSGTGRTCFKPFAEQQGASLITSAKVHLERKPPCCTGVRLKEYWRN